MSVTVEVTVAVSELVAVTVTAGGVVVAIVVVACVVVWETVGPVTVIVMVTEDAMVDFVTVVVEVLWTLAKESVLRHPHQD